MRVGVPTEVKNHEYRVAPTPAGAHQLAHHAHGGAVTRRPVADAHGLAAVPVADVVASA